MVHESHHLSVSEALAIVDWRDIWLAFRTLVVVTVASNECKAMIVCGRVEIWLQGVALVSLLDEAGASGHVEGSAEATGGTWCLDTLAGVWVSTSGAGFPLRSSSFIRA